MAKTLVIKNVNYSENKLDTVSLVGIPCTGISIAESSANVTYGEAYTVNVTVTPFNTTDEVVWSSDNENFTVSNGIVAIGGVGQAIITATCGEYSATVTLTSTATFDSDSYDIVDDHRLEYTDDYVSLSSTTSGKCAVGRVSETGYHALWMDAATKEIAMTFCPAIIPPGSTQMTILYSASYGQAVGFADMATQSTIGYGAVKIVSHDTANIREEERTLQIPSNADGYYLTLMGGIPFTVEFS